MAKRKAAKAAKASKRTARKAPARARRKVEAIPKLYGVLVPHLVVRGAADALAFYVKAFGAKEVGGRMTAPDGKVMHAEFRIGDRMLMIQDEAPEMGARSPQTLGGTAGGLLLYVKDTDAVFRRAIDAGAKALMEPSDQFWGDRYGKLVDPWGHEWAIATHLEDVTPKEMARRMAALPPA